MFLKKSNELRDCLWWRFPRFGQEKFESLFNGILYPFRTVDFMPVEMFVRTSTNQEAPQLVVG